MTKQQQAQQAIVKLNDYKDKFKKGIISYTTFKNLAQFYVDIYNNYSQEVAIANKLPVKKITAIGFLR